MRPDNIQSHVIFRRWAIVYSAALAVLGAWLLFEKSVDEQDNLLSSIKNTFFQSSAALAQYQVDFMQTIQKEAADYPSQSGMEYIKRAAKIVASLELFEQQNKDAVLPDALQVLTDSLILWLDGNVVNLNGGMIDTLLVSHCLKDHEAVKLNQAVLKAQMLAIHSLYYCETKIFPNTWICGSWYPDFLPVTSAPMVGQLYQAVIFLSTTESRLRCARWEGFLNGRAIRLRDGIAHLHIRFLTPGSHPLRFRFCRELCRDGSITEINRTFQVNVLERCDSLLIH